jgi:HEAT repeat protein
MNEIKKPCLDLPMSALIKDIVSKINTCAFNYSANDADVQKMAAAALENIKQDAHETCLSSVELGSTNNPSALAPLKKIAESNDSLVRTCAVSAIGTLGAQNNIDYLSGKLAQFSNNDKTMVLKAIGDAGSSKSIDILRKTKGDALYSDENGVKFCVDLYLAK